MATCSCSMNESGDWHAAADRARCSSRAAATRRSKQEVVQPRITFVRQPLPRAGARCRGLTTCAADSYRTETKVSCVAIASSRVPSARKLRCACNCEDQRTRRAPRPRARDRRRDAAVVCRSASGSVAKIDRRAAPDRSHTPGAAIAPPLGSARRVGSPAVSRNTPHGIAISNHQ